MLWGLIEEDIGVVWHSVVRTPHSLALGEDTSKPKVVSGADTYDEQAMPRAGAAMTVKNFWSRMAEAMTAALSQSEFCCRRAWPSLVAAVGDCFG